MTTEQLRLRYIGSFNRYWRTSIDHAGPTPAFLDDLVRIADEYAQAIDSAALRKQATPAPVIAAGPEGTAEGGGDSTPPQPSSHRTRTRTRRNEQA